jgi:HD-GYP domain-containing protein (c-di-GMP phosphodiesterase class II)
MTNTRAYSLSLTPTQAITELRRCAGTQFDTAATTALIAIIEETTANTTNHDLTKKAA